MVFRNAFKMIQFKQGNPLKKDHLCGILCNLTVNVCEQLLCCQKNFRYCFPLSNIESTEILKRKNFALIRINKQVNKIDKTINNFYLCEFNIFA